MRRQATIDDVYFFYEFILKRTFALFAHIRIVMLKMGQFLSSSHVANARAHTNMEQMFNDRNILLELESKQMVMIRSEK